jgi:hypothetical protein
MSRRAWLIPTVLAIVVAALVLLTPQKPSRSPDHRSESDSFDGTSALYSLAGRLGHPSTAIKGSFSLPEGPGVLFLFSPDNPFSDDQVAQLDQWVAAGGTVVYADTIGDPHLDQRLELSRAPGPELLTGGPDSSEVVHLTAASPLLAGVSKVNGSDASVPGADLPGYFLVVNHPAQVPLLRSDASTGEVVLLFQRHGAGAVVALSDPQALANGNLGQADNGRLAADLISMAPAGAPVLFDEYHHGAGGTTPSITDWLATPWGAVLGWALVVVYVGLLLRSRAFGPTISLAPSRDRSSAEYARAVGTLLRRAGARATTLAVIGEATRRALAARVGLGPGVSPGELDKVLQQRAPELAHALTGAEAAAAAGGQSERALLEAARRLHALAYPSAEKK